MSPPWVLAGALLLATGAPSARGAAPDQGQPPEAGALEAPAEESGPPERFGISLDRQQPLEIRSDEFEAIRLTDLEGLYQAEAAEKMSVSRQTLGRILESAHKKIADALVNGKALLIKGGPVEIIAASSETAESHRFAAGPKRGRGQCRRRGRRGPC